MRARCRDIGTFDQCHVRAVTHGEAGKQRTCFQALCGKRQLYTWERFVANG